MAGRALLQSAATSGNGNVFHCRGHVGKYQLEVLGEGTISAGAIQWEEADDPDYTGTWRPLGPAVTPVSGEYVTQDYEGGLRAVRARFSTSVSGSGGKATVRLRFPPVTTFEG